MISHDERPALALGGVVLFGLAILTAAVPVVGYVLLGLVILLVVGLLVGFAVMWRRTRWQPPDARHRPVRISVPATRSPEREVA
jgi:hypothetical protein